MSSNIFKPEGQLQRSNLEYSEELYELYLKDPQQVEDSWRWFFQGMHAASTPLSQGTSQNLEKEFQVYQLLHAYREYGNLKAQWNPLEADTDKGFPKLKDFQITSEDLNKKFFSIKHLLKKDLSLKQALDFLEKTYCGHLSLEVGSCHPKIAQWFFKEFETHQFQLSPSEKQKAFHHLVAAENLEQFLHFHFLGKKRFSLEGLDVLIPALEYLLEKGTQLKMTHLTLGMAHRGRINVLINVLKKNPSIIFAEFQDNPSNFSFSDSVFTGDVKYHLGFSSLRKTQNGPCHVYLGYNPSHLESVNPVICGITRALQRKNKDTQDRKTVVPVLIHGDASFCGQGSTSETLQLSQLKGYTVGGSIHIILNNQIGFTTTPQEGRSTLFASDLSKSIKAPVLLANANDVNSCLRAMDISLRFRQEFGQDIFVEFIGYRKYGHNEGDEPSFTQPILYKKIKKTKSVVQAYKESLLKENTLTEEKASEISKKINEDLEKDLKDMKERKDKFKEKDFIGIKTLTDQQALKTTSTSLKNLEEVFKVLQEEPTTINLHPKIKKLIEKRKKFIENDQLDWALCELASYGTLLKDGYSIRLSGQDSIRGTFSHRHAIYYDCETEKTYSPLKQLIQNKNQECCLYNSPLSEMAVLAFEYGNSCLAPDFLTLWEAQFGDFVNGAQIIIDQFIASGKLKWLQETDLTLLLPHGYEGQGPEHSSAYLERFLQLCAQDNMRVCNLTTPANLFHVLRRQKLLLKNRAPLVIMTPKSLLRHPEVISSKKDLLEGEFKEVIWDTNIQDPLSIKTLVLCSGKVFYDFKSYLSQNSQSQNHFGVFRIEQLYPFPDTKLNPILNGFPGLKKIIWLQEEPKNRGAWFYIKNQLEELLKALGQHIEIEYIGRKEGAASSEGSEKTHKKEQEKIMKNCLSSV